MPISMSAPQRHCHMIDGPSPDVRLSLRSTTAGHSLRERSWLLDGHGELFADECSAPCPTTPTAGLCGPSATENWMIGAACVLEVGSIERASQRHLGAATSVDAGTRGATMGRTAHRGDEGERSCSSPVHLDTEPDHGNDDDCQVGDHHRLFVDLGSALVGSRALNRRPLGGRVRQHGTEAREEYDAEERCSRATARECETADCEAESAREEPCRRSRRRGSFVIMKHLLNGGLEEPGDLKGKRK